MNEILREELSNMPSTTRLFFENIYNTFSPLGANDDFFRSLLEIISKKERPTNYFTHIASGDFKACFTSSDFPGYVIKFACSGEVLRTERNLYEIAKSSTTYPLVGEVFLDTYYFEMPRVIGAEDINGELLFASWLVVQPRVTPLNKFNSNLLFDDWLDYLPSKQKEEFLEFYNHFDMYDLAPRNIGFTASGQPVIFDWLS